MLTKLKSFEKFDKLHETALIDIKPLTSYLSLPQVGSDEFDNLLQHIGAQQLIIGRKKGK